MGFDRLLQQIPKQFAAVTNYGTRWVADLGPRHGRFDCEDEILHPEMIVGILEAGAEMMGVRDVQITFTRLAPRHYSYDITWGGAA